MQVLITRAEPSASRTASQLQTLGHEPVKLALTKLIDTGVQMPDAAFDGLIFTSANAPRVLGKRGWKNANADLPAFCVGKRTEEAAFEIGFSKTIIADGGGAKLAEKIQTYEFLRSPKLLYTTTVDRQFDMQSALERHSINVENCEIYQMQAVELARDQFEDALHNVARGAILVYSTESAKLFLNLIKSYSSIEILKKTRIITISGEAAKPFEAINIKNIYISPVPNEISMFHILDKIEH